MWCIVYLQVVTVSVFWSYFWSILAKDVFLLVMGVSVATRLSFTITLGNIGIGLSCNFNMQFDETGRALIFRRRYRRMIPLFPTLILLTLCVYSTMKLVNSVKLIRFESHWRHAAHEHSCSTWFIAASMFVWGAFMTARLCNTRRWKCWFTLCHVTRSCS